MNSDFADPTRARRGIQGPSWRWGYALELSSFRRFRHEDRVDELVIQAARFIHVLASEQDGRLRSADEYPVIATAKTLWDKPENRQQFIILTLADCPREQIAKRLNMDLNVIKTVESLFFDIRECREATSWINAHVILPESRSGAAELAMKYRAAFWGGPCVAETILDAGRVFSFDEVQRIADEEHLLRMKALAAADMPLGNQTEALQFLKVYLDHQNKNTQLEIRKEKFRFLHEQEIRKHELAERRQRAADKREERQIQAKLQRRDIRKQEQNEHERLAKLREHLKEERRSLEQQARIERAARSPLAQLSWAPSPKAESFSARESAMCTSEKKDAAVTPQGTHVAA